MKLTLIISAIVLSLSAFAQRHSLEGVWQGIAHKGGQNPKDGMALWMEFNIDASGEMTGFTRWEKPFEEYYAYMTVKGKAPSDSTITFEEVSIRKKQESSYVIWCKNKGELTYNAKSGYLKGSYKGTDCPRNFGKLVLYRSKYEMSSTDTNQLYHSWVNVLAGDLKRGWPAYYVRDAEMRNFEMLPVLFDHDKDTVKPEFHEYLHKMAKIVESHSDLRIKIIGHTDSNGTDDYNVDLSQRRADNVKAFLVNECGLKPDRVVIEFRGEKDPAVSNDTAHGKSLNRRVDFEFI